MVPRGIQISPGLQLAPYIIQHVQLRQGPGALDAVLGDPCQAVGSELVPATAQWWARDGNVTLTLVGHGRLQAVQSLLILTQVVGHVPIRVDGQQVSAPAGRTNPQCPLRLGAGAALWQRVDGARPRAGPSLSGSAPQAQILPDSWVSSGHVTSRHREGALGPRRVGLSTCHCPAAHRVFPHTRHCSLAAWTVGSIWTLVPSECWCGEKAHGETRPQQPPPPSLTRAEGQELSSPESRSPPSSLCRWGQHWLALCALPSASVRLILHTQVVGAAGVGPYRAMSSSTRCKWPQVAAACSGVQDSLSQALTEAPASKSCCTISRKSSMQLCRMKRRTWTCSTWNLTPHTSLPSHSPL